MYERSLSGYTMPVTMPVANKVMTIFVFLVTLTIITVTITSFMITTRQKGVDYYNYYIPWLFVDDNNNNVTIVDNETTIIVTTTSNNSSSNLSTNIPPPSTSESELSWKDEYDHEIHRFVNKYSRIWNVKSHHQWWSKHKKNDNNYDNNDDGLWFIKVPKSASSTIAGIVFNLQHYYDHYCCLINDNVRTISSNNSNSNTSYVQPPVRLLKIPLDEQNQEGHKERPFIHWEHGKAQDIFNIDRINNNMGKYFLFTPIRLPHKRALSDTYFHRISFHRRNSNNTEERIPNDNYIIKYLENDVTSNYIYNYIKLQTTTTSKTAHHDDNKTSTHSNYPIEDIMQSMIHVGDNNNKEEVEINETSNSNDSNNSKFPIYIPIDIEKEINSIMNTYNFMIVVERIDESIVVLSYLMNIPIQYFITISSKLSNSWYYQKRQNKKQPDHCMKLVSPIVSSKMNDYFESYNWLYKHQYDFILYHIANRSLDLTIEAIDRELSLSSSMTKGNNNNIVTIRSSIADMIVEYRAMKQHAENVCIVSSYSNTTSTTDAQNIPTTTTTLNHDSYYTPPCSDNGIPQLEKSKLNCHYRDFGCGHYCIYQTLLSSSSFNVSSTKQQQQ